MKKWSKKGFLAVTLAATMLVSTPAVWAAPAQPNGKGAVKQAQNQATIPYYVNESRLPFDALEGLETDRYWGVHNGAGYRIEVPKNWNGELVLYAHGYRGTGLELYVTDPRLREHFIRNGYAWAASSYSTNGYDVAQGVKDTHALGTLFNGIVKKPSKTYVTGHSMGGHITAVLAEQYRNAYVGALPMCGVTGDTALFDYFTDYNLVAQTLSGIEKEDQQFPGGVQYATETVPFMKQTLGINGTLTEEGQILKAVTKNLSGGERPLFDVAFEAYKNMLFDFMPADPTYMVAAGNVVDTTNSVYQFDSDMSTLSEEEQALNEMVRRIAAHPSSKQQGLTGVPKVKGNHNIPMVSIHNIGDLFVPFHMQQLHLQKAIANGKDDLLVTRVSRTVAHCGFPIQEEQKAFDDLVKWVEEGTRPLGHDILNPEAVADPSFGTVLNFQ